MQHLNKLVALFSVLIIVGCRDNPLLGEWVSADSNPVVCKKVKFTPDREFCDSLSNEVSYEISGSSVLVISKQKSALLPFALSYKVVAEDLISFTNPLTQDQVYLYRKGTSPISKEAVEYSKKYTLEELQRSCKAGPAKVTHDSKYWSETMPKKIHEIICLALELKKNS